MLNIKNEETYKLAKELSRLTGRSMTVAVTDAIREKITNEKMKTSRKKQKLSQELLKIAKRMRKPRGNQQNSGENA